MSDLLGDLEHLRTADAARPAVVDRSDRGFVRVTGPDARSFLQALVSADLDAVKDGDGAVSLLLHPQGKLDVAFRLLRVSDEELWLDTDPGLASRLVASLTRFKIRVDVTIDDVSDDTAMFSVVTGPPPGLAELHVHRPYAALTGVREVRTEIGWDLVGDRATIEAAGVVDPDVSADAWEAFRIERGVPLQPIDIDDSTIPQEAELELDAVSFTKGCFIGQELVCRIDSRGHVNRFLRRLTAIDGPRPTPGTEIVVDGKVVGAVTSGTPEPFAPLALGYVRREVEPGATVELRAPSGTATATVTALRGERPS